MAPQAEGHEHVRSVEWTVAAPGIVSIKPGNEPYLAVLTGVVAVKFSDYVKAGTR